MVRDSLKTLVKDALRGARYGLRHTLRAPPPLFPGQQSLTLAADAVFTRLEDAVQVIRHGDLPLSAQIGSGLQDIVALAGRPADGEAESRIAAALYRLAKGILTQGGAVNVYLLEGAFSRAARMIHLPTPESPDQRGARVAAAVALALIDSAPIRLADFAADRGPDLMQRSPNIAVGLIAGLTIAAWIDKRGKVDGLDCMTSAAEIVAVKADQMQACLATDTAVTTLAAHYARLAVHVP